MPLIVEILLKGRPEPMTTYPAESVRDALLRMIDNDYSQLPVVDGDGKASGMFTYESILRAMESFGVKHNELHVADAIVVNGPTFRADDDLFNLLDALRDHYSVLIVDREGKVIGIVTNYDTTEYFRQRAQDMMLVEEIENTLKAYTFAAFMDETGTIDNAALESAIEKITPSNRKLRGPFQRALAHYFHLEGDANHKLNNQSVEAAFDECLYTRQQPKSADDLTLSELAELFLHRDRWDHYNSTFTLDPDAIRRLLDSIRETRNGLAHFRAEITPRQHSELQFCKDWLARHEVGVLAAFGRQQVVEPEREPLASIDLLASPEEMELGAGQEPVPVEETRSTRESRYAPFATYLEAKDRRADHLQLTFQHIEEIIGDTLPASARAQRSWWANDPVGHVQSQQWLNVGWRVGRVNLSEENVTFARISEREQQYVDFWNALIADLRSTEVLRRRTARSDGSSWIRIMGLRVGNDNTQSVFLGCSFSRSGQLRVELYIDSGDRQENKHVLDALHLQRREIESEIGEPLSWERIDDKQASRIALYHEGTITSSPAELADLRQWAVAALPRLHAAIEPRLRTIGPITPQSDFAPQESLTS